VSVCPRCWRDPPPFETVTAAFLFEGVVREAIHRLKYDRARYLAAPLVELVIDNAAVPPGDLVVPVPLHPDRLRARGYNQAELIARGLADRVSLPIDRDLLVRVRDTAAQVAVPPARRWENVRGAFAAPDGSFDGQRVLLIDDVATSASTLRAAGSAVARAGARRVDAIVIARTGSDAPGVGTGVASPRD
jgi:ComF family protein